MTTLYGIKNCDTIKKARKWLEQHQIPYQFHDYRQDGLDKDWLNQRVQELGWQQVLNKRGTTYRQLSDEQKANLDEASAIELLAEYPAMIKRPLLAHDGQHYLGFKADDYAEVFNAK
ncbi:Arsenate reductase (glutaredoxin) [Saliniradius amylolyticus]|uniref:Arsenate reductase (Glutaredoxin) n=1 Tax=Saliniradius amylolyticus TaxID=2183582 RepID=A0A2S2E394_9ALTE|nr:ArsC family reductase [Saliniradius amylolyticus]AWL12118.1 Arsenate reductase (glutaredoxin) [Saliniradius amylolyticus]